MNLYTHAEANTRKTWLYLAGFFVFVIGVGWLASYLMETPTILWIAVVLSIVMSLSSYWYSDRLVIALTKAKPASKEEYIELHRIVENLAITAGLPKPRVFVIDDAQSNAFATGRNAQHAVVAVTAGLLSRLDRTELEGVLAHELSHIGNKDMLLATIVVVLVGIVTILVDFFSDRQQGSNAVFLVIGLAMLILAPILAKLIQSAVSRKREFLADASGALLTRYPEGLARALEKIASHPSQMRSASDATAHLFFASPFRGKESASWIHKLFMTHPPMEQRVAALRGMSI
ncbi:MAG: Protease HtpX [Parcubacteria group bacterium Greene0416_39]|nr:MAG: Protease HtpX [Parcubacteria group bacterium Greene0416_39]